MGLKRIKHKNITLPKKTKLFRQTYDRADGIYDVLVCKSNTFADDFGGWFKETLRLDRSGLHIGLKEQGVSFKPIQINTSFLAPKAKRFWHIHPQQNEIWTTSGTLILGLIDFRPESPSYLTRMKIILSPDKYIYIPCGVAHGFMNLGHEFVTLNYFTDHYFVGSDKTQEYRIDPKDISYDFVKPEVM